MSARASQGCRLISRFQSASDLKFVTFLVRLNDTSDGNEKFDWYQDQLRVWFQLGCLVLLALKIIPGNQYSFVVLQFETFL